MTDEEAARRPTSMAYVLAGFILLCVATITGAATFVVVRWLLGLA